VGAAVWLLLATTFPPPGLFLGTAELLFLVAPLVVVPLTLAQIASGPGAAGRVLTGATLLQPAAALVLLSACWFPPGHTAGTLTLPWLLLTMAVAASGALRLREAKSLQHACFALGQVYLAVGGAWAFASRWGMTPLGFREPWVILTANHFHYAGYATAMIVGLTLPRVRGRATAIARASGVVILGGPPIVAAGIAGIPVLEVVSAVTLATGLLVFAGVTLLHVAPRTKPRAAGLLLGTSAVALVVTMALATTYATSHYAGHVLIEIPTMVQTHGLLNVLGFCVSGLLGLYASTAVDRPISPLGDRGSRVD
jgi:hypothetical protein